MPSGKLGSVNLAANTTTLLFTVAATPQSFNVRFTNRNNTSAQIRLAIGTGSSPSPEDYMDYNLVLPAYSVLEDTGIVASLGEKVWVYSDIANVSVRAHGL